MISYLYNKLEVDEPIEMTEVDILNEYWDHWSEQMISKYGPGHELINTTNCIEDWIAVNWAWRKPDD